MRTCKGMPAVLSVCMAPDGMHVLSASYDGRADLAVWRWVSGAHPQGGKAVLLGVHGARWGACAVGVARQDVRIVVWDGSLVRTLQGHTAEVSSVCMAPDGMHVLSASSDKTVRIWLLDEE